MLLKHFLGQQMSKPELSRRFEFSRRTIHHWVATGQLDCDLDAVPSMPGTGLRGKRRLRQANRGSNAGSGS